MISLLQGKIIQNENGEITLLTAGGVGYKIFGSPKTLLNSTVGNEITIETYLVVREDALDLFGFVEKQEKELFKQFLSVSGVGPKTALHLLGLGSVSDISSAIVKEDIDYLTKVSGIGKKTAERIVVELKSKLKEQGTMNDQQFDKSVNNVVLRDVIDGLVALGYSMIEARETVKKLNAEGKTSERLLKEALQHIK